MYKSYAFVSAIIQKFNWVFGEGTRVMLTSGLAYKHIVFAPLYFKIDCNPVFRCWL